MNIDKFLENFSPKIQSLSNEVRRLILTTLPKAVEEIDISSNLIGYGITPGLKGTVFTLMPTKNHVTIGFYKGTELEDPHKLLTGTGKVHRHVKVKNIEQLSSFALINLVEEAVGAIKLRVECSMEK
ncbi:MAG: hypothetical protein FD147_1812 [Chloroflexi bacterium]|nr:MAG: hypothetical protein FD147_1812 [Chloroflexota bacterium]MBA4376382.1 hypothetical protein [Anaerolinea sp.]